MFAHILVLNYNNTLCPSLSSRKATSVQPMLLQCLPACPAFALDIVLQPEMLIHPDLSLEVVYYKAPYRGQEEDSIKQPAEYPEIWEGIQ